ncbi:CBO0543 family protein [Halalkalibacter akibai]|uniref:Uncharacterized protein n=1 Tax=Halalkalibacter akibai (strain ATCC 43226 / DSM 21942 / CIP 109018 / JCM 9157 / 1139) TaxID=1236973 RepID=W4QTN3_HALA3|nr:CBO0543 family protein [Halalkalibacter akibai]GAE35520.1 hypothetical protein JCM9157_2632 [Halalkalibacter akibai JCM 9157]
MNRISDRFILRILTIVATILLPFAIIKRPLKDWIIVYIVSCVGNSMADHYLVSKGYLKYKVRPMSKRFSIHLPFDYVHYPLLLLYYNQWTLNSKPIGLFFKLFPFIIPQTIIETIAEKRTDLITWKKGWSWKHSAIGMLIKFLVCRSIIATIRVMNKKENSIN